MGGVRAERTPNAQPEELSEKSSQRQKISSTVRGQGVKGLILGQGFSGWVDQALPVGGVCQQVGQYSAQQGQRDLLHVQAEDAVEQLHHPIGPLLSSLLQQLLKRDECASITHNK